MILFTPQLELETSVMVGLWRGGEDALGRLPTGFRSTVFSCGSYQSIFKAIKRVELVGSHIDRRHVELHAGEKLANEIVDIDKRVALEDTLTGKALTDAAAELILRAEQRAPAYTGTPGGTQPEPKLQVFKGSDLRKMEVAAVDDLVVNILRRRSLSFLAGEEGAGKSLLAMNLGLAVAIGGKSFLDWELKSSGKVLYINLEMNVEDVRSRFVSMSDHLPAPGNIDNFILLHTSAYVEEFWNELEALCVTEHPVLVILDCLYYAHNMEESDNSAMKAMMRKLQSLRDKHNLCVLVVHHTKKGTRNDRLHNDLMRGAGVFGAAADTVLMLRRSQTSEGKRILKPTKLRHAPDEFRSARLLALDATSLWFRDQGKANEADHIAALVPTVSDAIEFDTIFGVDKELSFKDIKTRAAPLGVSEKSIQREVKESVDRGELIKVRHGFYSLAKMDNVDTPTEK